MRQSNSSGAMSSQSYGYRYPQQQPYGAYGGYTRGQAPWDWRDYFVSTSGFAPLPESEWCVRLRLSSLEPLSLA
jgi:hypothetical protein